MTKSNVVARLTVTRALGNLTVIEVHADATFTAFYQIYTQTGRRRSTKRMVRTANRNEGLRPYHQAHLMQPGLDKLAEHWKQQPGVTSVKIRIIKKRLYRKLISAGPDELGMTQLSPSRVRMQRVAPLQVAVPVAIQLHSLSVAEVQS